MLEIALLLVVLTPAPLLAIVVLAARLRGAAGTKAARRGGVGRPVWPALAAVTILAALLTAGLERAYLATVANGPRWGIDLLLLTLVLGLLAVIVCATLAGLAAAAVGRARGFGAGAVAGTLALLAVVLVWALPWPVLGAAFGARTAPAAARDAAQLLLDLATADLPGNRSAWGAALRAELAAIDPVAERRRFALGGAWAALRSGGTHDAWVAAAVVAFGVAGGSFAASRWSLAHDQGGILSFWIAVPSALLVAVALAAAWRNRSFGAGLRTGVLSGLAALLAVVAVGLPEAVVWANRQAGYLSTGDAVPPTWQAAALDVVRPDFLIIMIVFWTAGTAGGAALGKALSRRPARTPS